MGKIGNAVTIWTFPNPTGGIYLPKTDSASLAFQLLPVYNLQYTPVVSLYKHLYNAWLQYIKELNKPM